MQSHIVYVHGAGRMPSRSQLKLNWDMDLFGRDMGFKSTMAYWAPLQHRAPEDLDSRLYDFELHVADRLSAHSRPRIEYLKQCLSEAQCKAEKYGRLASDHERREIRWALNDWLFDMVHRADSILARGCRDASDRGSSPPATLTQNRHHGELRQLAKSTFADAYSYFFSNMGAALRREVANSIAEAGNERSLVVISHGIGTIIAYEVLRSLRLHVEAFITLGSPLGVREIQECLGETLSIPTSVANWWNVSDPRDVATLGQTLQTGFSPGLNIMDVCVSNRSGTSHEVSEYLSHDAVRQLVRGCAAASQSPC